LTPDDVVRVNVVIDTLTNEATVYFGVAGEKAVVMPLILWTVIADAVRNKCAQIDILMQEIHVEATRH
jgi:hypothetical protein